jgi:hypothetical protein
MTAVSEFEAKAGKRMSLLQFSTPMAYPTGDPFFAFPTAEFDKVRHHGSLPFFSWSTHAMGNFSHPRFTLRAIAAGEQDASIAQWAAAARDWGHPFFLRFNWEMNGDWFPWGERYGGNAPGEFVAAWRHVHDIFDQVGATNATWVWCPTTDRWKTLQPLRDLYPGGAYVDWTCLDGYNANDPWSSFTELFGSTYDEIVNDIAPDKPMVIGETGSTESGGDKAAWITDMFTVLPTRFPRVRALIWFDYTVPGSFNYTDWPIDTSPSAAQAFASGVGPDRYRTNDYASWSGPLPLGP